MFEVEFYRLPDNTAPVENFLDSLDAKMRAKSLHLWHARKICTLTGSFTAMPRAPSQRGLALSAAR